jgi:HPt (histidine-containing phosphotransfer) domain-containing protein
MAEQITVEVDSDLKDLIPNFLANRRKESMELEQAVMREDFEALRMIGHNMKGVGGGYGFQQITDLGIEIEDAAKHRDGERVRRCLQRYRVYLESVSIVFV